MSVSMAKLHRPKIKETEESSFIVISIFQYAILHLILIIIHVPFPGSVNTGLIWITMDHAGVMIQILNIYKTKR